MSERELWEDAIRLAEEAGQGEITLSMLRMGADGHRNRRHIAEHFRQELTGCPCGAETPCADEIETTERIRLRAALAALVAHLGVPERVERGQSPP